MPRIYVRLLLVLLFLAAATALLVNTQSLSASPPANAAADRDKDKDKNKDKDKDRDDRGGNVVIAQLSDSHIGLGTAPEASANLRRAVDMINQRNVDAVIMTGDLGERPDAWKEARQ